MVVIKRVGSSNGFSRRDASCDGMFLVANNRRVGSRMVGHMKFDNRKVASRNDGLTERMVAADLQSVNLFVYKPNHRLKMFPQKNAQLAI